MNVIHGELLCSCRQSFAGSEVFSKVSCWPWDTWTMAVTPSNALARGIRVGLKGANCPSRSASAGFPPPSELHAIGRFDLKLNSTGDFLISANTDA